MAIDQTAMFAMSYGLYVVSAEADGLKAGCVVNTACLLYTSRCV